MLKKMQPSDLIGNTWAERPEAPFSFHARTGRSWSKTSALLDWQNISVDVGLANHWPTSRDIEVCDRCGSSHIELGRCDHAGCG